MLCLCLVRVEVRQSRNLAANGGLVVLQTDRDRHDHCGSAVGSGYGTVGRVRK